MQTNNGIEERVVECFDCHHTWTGWIRDTDSLTYCMECGGTNVTYYATDTPVTYELRDEDCTYLSE